MLLTRGTIAMSATTRTAITSSDRRMFATDPPAYGLRG
jgi:hypothetical protein